MSSAPGRRDAEQLRSLRPSDRRRTGGTIFAATLLISLGVAGTHAGRADAGLACAFDAATGTLSLAPGAGALRVGVGVAAGPSPPAGAIVVTDVSANAPVVVACAAGATVRVSSAPSTANTAKIVVAGGSDDDLLEIDLSGGSFRSALNADGEVSWSVALGGGTDTLRIKGNKLGLAANFRVVYGNAPGPVPTAAPAGSLNLTAGSDARADVSIDTDVEVHQAIMGAGDDVLSGDGAFGTGGPWEATGLDFDGGDGDDVLEASNLNLSKSNINRQTGGAGNDTLTFEGFGSAGVQLTQDGGDGYDVLRATTVKSGKSLSSDWRQAGGAGDDELTVESSNSSRLRVTQDGGPGGDVVFASNLNLSKSNINRQTGGAGNDTLTFEGFGSAGVQLTQDGGGGDDVLQATSVKSGKSLSSDWRQAGGAGDDELTVESSNSSRLRVTQDGGPGGDVVFASNLNLSKSNINRQTGGAGSDKLTVENYNSPRVKVMQNGGPGGNVVLTTTVKSSKSSSQD